MRTLYRLFHKVLKRSSLFVVMCIKKTKRLGKNRFALFTSGAVVMLILMVLVASLWRSHAATYTQTWTAQTDFDNNAVTGQGATTKTNVDTSTTAGSVLLAKQQGSDVSFSELFTDTTNVDTGALTATVTGGQLQSGTTSWTQTDWSSGVGASTSTQYSAATSIDSTTNGQFTLLAGGYSLTGGTWTYRKKVTFDNSAQAENLTNFPVLIKLSASNFDFSKAQSAGQDIRFTDSDGSTELSYEIEKWDNSGQTAAVWVKVPQINTSSNTDYIYMFYGNGSIADGQAVTSVWSNGYQAVWHLSENPAGSSPQMLDSTANNHDGTTAGSMTSGQQVAGKVGGSLDLTGDDNVSIPDSTAWILGTSTLTIEGWVKSTDTAYAMISQVPGLAHWMLSYGHWGGIDVCFYSHDGGASAGCHVTYNTTTPKSGNWYYFTIVRDAVGSWILYIDGAQVATGSGTSSMPDLAAVMYLGGPGYGGGYLIGQIDEYRFSDLGVARSAPWIAAQYKSMADTFNTYALEETNPITTGDLTSNIFDVGVAEGATWGALTYTTDGNGTSTVKVRTSNSATMDGATAFGTCNAVTSGADISANNCVTDGQRYIQYFVQLDKTAASPIFQDIATVFVPTSGGFVAQSIAVDTFSTNIVYATLTKNDTPGAGTVSYQLSNDGGTTFATVTPTTLYTFATTGTSLKWKITLTGNATVQDITITYNGYKASGSITNLKIDAGADAVWTSLSWEEILASGTDVTFRTRGATNAEGSGALSSASWSSSSYTTPAGSAIIDNTGASTPIFRYVEIEMNLTSTGANGGATPQVDAFTIEYVMNSAPTISNVTASQGSNGIVTVGYDMADSEENSATVSLYYRPASVTVNEELTDSDTTAIIVSDGTQFPDAGTMLIDNEVITYTSKSGNNLQGTIERGIGSSNAVAHITGTAMFVKAVTVSGHTGVSVTTGTGKSATWTPTTDFDGMYASVVMKVWADDGNAANQFGTANATAFNLDTKDPASVSLVVSAGKETANRADLTIAGSDDNSLTMVLSNDSGLAADTVNATSGQSVAFSTSATDWVLQTNPDTVYVRVTDAKGNASSIVSSATPATPASLALVETSNTKVSPEQYRLFVSWGVVATPGPGFGSYKVYRKTTGAYALLSTIADSELNYYQDITVAADTEYTYYIVTVDTNGNISQRSSTISGTANGIVDSGETAGGDDQTAPTITAGPTASVSGTTVTITWTTNEASDSNVDYSTNTSFNITKGVPTVTTSHSVEITGLSGTTAYKYRIRSRDASGNQATDNNSSVGHPFTTGVAPAVAQGNLGLIIVEPDKIAPNILVFEVVEVAGTTARISIRTDEQATAEVSYGLESGKLITKVNATTGLATAHDVSLSGLSSGKTYYAQVEVKDSSNNSRKSEIKQFKTTGTLVIDKDVKKQETPAEEKEQQESDTQKQQIDTGEKNTENIELKLNVPITKTENSALRKEIVNRLALDFQEVIKLVASGTLKEDTSSLGQFISSLSEEIPAPQIIEGLPIIDITSTTATFAWKTDKPSNSLVAIVPVGLYKSTAVEPYIIETGNSRELVTDHTVTVTELRPDAAYHYQIRSQGSLGLVAKSRDYEFKTLSERLDIIVAEVLDIKPTRATVYWRTTIDADSQVEFTPLNENGEPIIKDKGTQGKTDTSLEHTVEIQNLSAGKKYLLRVISRDKSGQTIDRYLNPIKTPTDSEKPEMSQITSESTLYPGAQPKVQTLILWKTNEQSNSQVMYWPGLKEPATEEEKMRTQVSNEYTKNHVIVVTNLVPGNVYQYRVKSVDESGNITLSEAYTMLAPSTSESVIDVITKNFADIFGWLRLR